MKKVLIAGGSGFIGQLIYSNLKASGFSVVVVTRTPTLADDIFWNPSTKEIDLDQLKDVEVLINLTGAGVGDSRWTSARKKEMYASRIETTQFLYGLVDEMPKLNVYVSASGVNCYGYDDDLRTYSELDPFGGDYLSQLVKDWEASADLFLSHCRVVKMRMGVVLDNKTGAVAKMAQPISRGIGSPLGSGEQIISWVHKADVARAYHHVICSEIEGSVNLVGGNDTNLSFVQAIARNLHRKLILPAVPAWVLRLVLGEMSIIVLKGITASSQKLKDSGFQFQYEKIDEAVTDIFKS